MANQNNQFWLLWCFAIAGMFLSAGKMEAQGQTKPGNVSSTVELWLRADQGVNIDEASAKNNVTEWMDQSGKGRNYNGSLSNNLPTFNETTYLMNFQPSIDFRGTAAPNTNQKLISASNHFLSASNAYYVFYVSQQAASAAGFATVYAFNAASAGATRNDDYGWLNGKPVFRTASATANSHQGNGKLYGINAVILPNNGTVAQKSYMNGVVNSPAFGTATLSMTTPGVSVIGSSNAGTAATDIFKGNVQEIIILSGPAGSDISVGDLKKINSYLAIKYGITLNNADDYVNSDGTVVWNRSGNSGYNNNIFGIGRDNESGLNQVQSCSMESDMITIFKGTLNDLNDKSSEELSDKTFLILGSTGNIGVSDYIYAVGDAFSNNTLTEKINYIQKNIYKAQITSNGTANSGSQTVNMKIGGIPNGVKYVLVSSDPLFAAGSAGPTRIYSVVNQIATDVLINEGDFIVLAGYQATPGGITDAGAVAVAWLSPENYNSNGTWINQIAGASSIGDFKMPTGATDWSAPASGTMGGYNFHPVVMFNKPAAANAPNRLNSNQFDISATDAVTAIFVLQKSNTQATNSLIGFTTITNNTGLWWATANNDNLTFGWNASRGVIGAVKDGILTVDNSNIAATALQEGTRFYTNGFKIPYASYNWNNSGVAVANRVVALGSGRTDAASNGFQGNLQEVILIKKSGNAHIANIDMQKIHSYLAVKYGITLNNSDNYINSDGNIVWNKSMDATYNNNIFGIGRDDRSGLNQVQSRCADNDIITLFAGTLNELNDNNSRELPDKAFLVLGSNGLVDNVKYEFPANAQFENDKLGGKLNYRSKFVYMAQVTDFDQPVNIKVNYTFANYILVSDDANFPASSTNIYPINGQVAAGVVLDDTHKYIAIAGYEAKPGGIDLDGNGYDLDLWVDGNNSTNSSWNNLIPATYSLVKASDNAPIIRNSRFNFNKEIFFNNTTNSKLFSSSPFNLLRGDAYHIFVVSDAEGAGAADMVLFTFNNSFTYANLRWNNSSNTSILSSYWTTTLRPAAAAGFAVANFPRYGIATLNIANTNNSPFDIYLNRSKISSTLGTVNNGNGSAQYNLPLLVGNISPTPAGSANRFSGSIQEMIFIRKSSSTDLMPDNMIAKIHSYLAIKYGITLPEFDYVNSGGNIVWSKDNNSGYSSNIFGIGRDDDSGLYQKQSRSVKDNTVTIFVGDEVTELNRDNTGTLDDKQYVMIGRNDNDTGDAVGLTNGGIINNGNPFANGQFNNNLSNLQSPRYKVQLTSASLPVKVKLMSPSDPFKYVIVSKKDAFDNKSDMKIYPVENGAAEVEFDNDFKFFKFIGSMEGPGGVSVGLLLWLEADNPASLSIVNYPLTDPTLNGYLFAKDPAAIPTVDSWSDLKREYTWNYANGGTSVNRRRPVFENSVRKMNYHPAVRFWGNGTTTGAYLANKTGIIAKHPTTHTAFFMMNSALNDNSSRIYEMMFTPNLTAPGVNGPAYGIEKRGIKGMGRYRGIANSDGNKDLFTVGTTTIASYYVQDAAGTGVKFRFNGIENTGGVFTASSACSLAQGSVLGMGYDNSRTVQGFISEVIIYNGLVESGPYGIENRDKIESYLALKYGVTLYPFPEKGTENKFDYKFSSGEYIWQGQTGDSKFAAFYKRIAAVVRDDIASLDNKQTISTDIGSMLHFGVAGTVLDINGKGELGDLNNMEAVAFGDNNAFGFTDIKDNVCGDFDSRFNRIWLVHKKTENDRPVKIIVGIQDNSSDFGSDESDKENKANDEYYAKLNGMYDILLVVADSPEDIQNENYKRVIPMTYLNGVWQCIYEFSDEDTYITFGTKPNNTGCVPDEESAFVGTKTFSWTQWTTRTNLNPSTSSGFTLPATPFAPLDLGDNIQVLQTQVSYPPNVRTYMYYPRSTGIPVRGSLELPRRQGTLDQDVVVTVTFNHPVIPEFSISGLDCYGSYAFEEVEITGGCSAGDESFMPELSYTAPRSSRTSYQIDGNKATVTKRGYMSGTDKNARVNVKFLGSVSTITIKYRIKGKIPATASQRIYISPITFKTVPPPPPVNEDGLSFVKDVKEYNITTCEPAEYSFYIQNTNCDVKTVDFSDVLPAKMKWDTDSFVLDTLSSNINQEIEYKSSGGTLKIDGLQLPSSATLILKASAVLDADAPDGKYDNQATVSYDLIKENILTTPILESLDRYTHNPKTSFTATWQQRPEQVRIDESYSLSKYKENNEITVTYKINNPNQVPVTDMFLDIDFNEEFTYVDESFSGGIGTLAPIFIPDPDNPSVLTITGSLDGADGFTLPQGETVITFKLKAPDVDHLRYELDNAGQPTEKKADLNIIYNFSSTMDDPCVIESIKDLSGDKVIPYSTGLNYVISNRNVSSRIE